MKKLCLMLFANLILALPVQAVNLKQITINLFDETKKIDSPMLALLLAITAIGYGIVSGLRKDRRLTVYTNPKGEIIRKVLYGFFTTGILYCISLFFDHFKWYIELGILFYTVLAGLLLITSRSVSREEIDLESDVYDIWDRNLACREKTLYILSFIAPALFLTGTYITFYICCNNLFVPTIILVIFLLSQFITYTIDNWKEITKDGFFKDWKPL